MTNCITKIEGISPKDYDDDLLDNYLYRVSAYDTGSLESALQKVSDIQKESRIKNGGHGRCLVILYLHDFTDWERMPIINGVRCIGSKLPVETDYEYYFGIEHGLPVEYYTEFPCPIIEDLFRNIDTDRLRLVHQSDQLSQKYDYISINRTLWEDWLYRTPLTWKFTECPVKERRFE